MPRFFSCSQRWKRSVLAIYPPSLIVPRCQAVFRFCYNRCIVGDPSFMISRNGRNYLPVFITSCVIYLHNSGWCMCTCCQRMARVAPARTAPVLWTCYLCCVKRHRVNNPASDQHIVVRILSVVASSVSAGRKSTCFVLNRHRLNYSKSALILCWVCVRAVQCFAHICFIEPAVWICRFHAVA